MIYMQIYVLQYQVQQKILGGFWKHKNLYNNVMFA